jgi:F-type H+-transporting ATPase subunit epsilon
MRLRVLTPERTVVDTEVAELTAPGFLGELGVLRDHITYLGTLDTGELRYRSDGAARLLVLLGGVVEVVDNAITVLADEALSPEEIDLAAAQQQLTEAEAALGHADPYGEGYAAADRARRWALLRARVAERPNLRS